MEIFTEYFDEKKAQSYAGRNDVLFVSDVRSAEFRTMKDKEVEDTVWQDMQLQHAFS